MASSRRANRRPSATASASQPGHVSRGARGYASSQAEMRMMMTAGPHVPVSTLGTGWPPRRCEGCRRLTRWFGCGARWNDIGMERRCRVCSLQKDVLDLRAKKKALVDTLCAAEKQRLPLSIAGFALHGDEDQDQESPRTRTKRLPVRVLRDCYLWELILEYASRTPKLEYGVLSAQLCEMHVQEHIWMKVLRGKYVWDFDCGEAAYNPFSGYFGVNSWKLVGRTGRPVQLQVLFGTELPAKHRTTDLTHTTRYTILHLVIQYLGPFQPWMVR